MRRGFVRFMEEIISKGYARKSAREAASEMIWYLPHHGLYHPNKSGKVRLVFDLSADHNGRCINRELLSELDLTNQKDAVLLWFREEQVAVMGGIETMFDQVKFADDQCSFLRFLWWDDCDTNKEIIDHKMTAHVFGRALSPSSSNFVLLRKTAIDSRNEYASDVTRILEKKISKKIYVDDMLKSFQTVTEAKDIIREVKELYAKGGFNLTSSQVIVKVLIPDKNRRVLQMKH